MKTVSLIAIIILLANNVLADTFRVHSSIRGVGQNVTMQAESPAEARRTVMDMFPDAVVIGVSRIKKTIK
jgi:hypothetical protein